MITFSVCARAGVKFLNKLEAKRVFPAFEAILAQPKHHREVSDVFGVLVDLKGDRRRFVEPAVRHLAHADAEVRLRAVRLLGIIGTVAEASPVVALLSDSDEGVVGRAAEALMKFGGPRELLAMDVWLLGASHRDDAQLRHRVKECRDQLKKRLDKQPATKKK
jgi:HEAT repeat protein